MKKKKVNGKLNLNKKAISNLNAQAVNGGFTSGCTDGCGPFQTEFRCTQGDCTNDCHTGPASINQSCTCTKECPQLA